MGLSTLVLLCCGLAGYQVLSAALPAQRNEAVNGDYILNLGNAFNESMLRLVGKVFLNFERNMSQAMNQTRAEIFLRKICESNECGQWSEWSECPAEGGHFAWVTRTRVCGQNSTQCTYSPDKSRTEEDTKICVGDGEKDEDDEEEDDEEEDDEEEDESESESESEDEDKGDADPEYAYPDLEYYDDDGLWDALFGME